MKKRIVVGISGASSILYAQRFLYFLHKVDAEIHLIISSNALGIIHQEAHTLENTGEGSVSSITQYATHIYTPENFFAPVASGSFLFDAMVIIPCSMNTLAHITNGITHNLIHRVADVCIKEKRTLILVPRESPLSSIHLSNMLTLSQSGVHIVPPIPALYMAPQTLTELVDFSVLRIIDLLGIPHSFMPRWGETNN